MKKQELILRELEQIASENDGLLRPEDVVEFARNPQTALHSRFDWKDTSAAHQWRLFQARQVIKATVKYEPAPGIEKFRAFVSCKDDRYNGLGYRPTITVLNDVEMRRKLLAEAQEDAQSFIAKYEELEEWARVISEMRRVVKKPTAKRKYKRSQQLVVNA